MRIDTWTRRGPAARRHEERSAALQDVARMGANSVARETICARDTFLSYSLATPHRLHYAQTKALLRATNIVIKLFFFNHSTSVRVLFRCLWVCFCVLVRGMDVCTKPKQAILRGSGVLLWAVHLSPPKKRQEEQPWRIVRHYIIMDIVCVCMFRLGWCLHNTKTGSFKDRHRKDPVSFSPVGLYFWISLMLVLV